MKLTRKQYDSLCGSKAYSRFIKPFLVHTLTRTKDTYVLRTDLCLPLYILITVPLHIIKFFICLWDGGLREFNFEGPYIGRFAIFPGDRIWKQVDEIWAQNQN